MRKICFTLLVTVIVVPPLQAQLRIGNYKEAIYGMDISPDGHTLAYAVSDSLFLWSLEAQKSASGFQLGSTGKILSVDYSEKGDKIAFGITDSTVLIFDLYQKKTIHKLNGAGGVITSVKFSPDDSFLAAACSNHCIYLWETNNIAAMTKLEGHNGDVTDIEFLDSTHLAACDGEGKILIWNLPAYNIESSFKANNGWTRDIIKNKKQQLISCGDDAMVRCWEFDRNYFPRLISSKRLGTNWLISLDLQGDEFTGAVSMNKRIYVNSVFGKYRFYAGSIILKILFVPETVPFKVIYTTLDNGIFLLEAESMKLN